MSLATKGMLGESLYAGKLVLMSETTAEIEICSENQRSLLRAKQNKQTKHNKTDEIISGGITKDALANSKALPCRICNLRVKANSAL